MALIPASAINGQTTFSTSLWFRTTRDADQTLIKGARLSDGAFVDNLFTVALHNGSRMRFNFNNSPFQIAQEQILPIPPINDGEYHHLVIVRDAASLLTKVFLDGDEVGSFAMPANSYNAVQLSDAYFVLGSDITSSTYATNPARRFEGDLSDLSIWSRALTFSEIQSLYSGNMKSSDPVLRAWYKLDEASGLELIDSTGRNANGRLGKPNDPSSLPTRTVRPDRQRSLPLQPNVDLNADGVSDVVIGASFSSSTGPKSGQIHFLYGERASQKLPAVFDVLENWSVAGSGSFVKDTGTGRPTRFDLGGTPFTFATGSSERWFQFTTVGDGKADNMIQLNGQVRMDLLDSLGGVLVSNQSAISMRTLTAGTYYLRVFAPSAQAALANAPSIPLGNLFDDSANTRLTDAVVTDSYRAIAEAADLGVDSVRLGGTSTFNLDAAGLIPFNFTNVGWQNEQPAAPPTNDAHRPGIGDASIRTTRESSPVSTNFRIEEGIGIHANGLVTFDLNEIRKAGGYDPSQPFRLIIDKAGLNDTGPVGTIRNLVLVSSSNSVLSGFINGQAMTIVNTAGTLSYGGTIPAAQTSSTFSSYDVNLPGNARYLSLAISGAGDSIFQDHGVFTGARLIPVGSFTIDMSAPQAGQTHEGSGYPDRDILSGGDGSDIVQGNNDLDRIYGGDGSDTITGEPVELRDNEVADGTIRNVPSTETTFENTAPIIDPIIGTAVLRQLFDNFELTTLNTTTWPTSTNAVSSDQGLNEPSGTRSVRFSGGSNLTSKPINLSGASSGYLTYQFQKAGGGESPDPGDDLIVEVESLTPGTFDRLDIQFGNGADMTNFAERRIELPATALRDGVRFRIRTLGANGFDNWFVDDLAVFASYGSQSLQAALAQNLGDPVTFGPVSGKNAIDFDGVDDRVRVPFNAALNPAGDFSIEFWARVDGGAGSTRTAISTGGNIGFHVSVNTANRWEFRTESQFTTDILTAPSLASNQLTHIAATFDSTSGPDVNGNFSGQMNLYIDGQLVAARSGLYKPQTSRDLLIGAHAAVTPTTHFNGILDEVRIWNTVRTANQIESNFRGTISPSSPANSNLVAYYRLDEGVGTIAADITVPQNNGTLEGSPSWTSASFETQPILHQPLTASRLASLIHVNASNGGIADLSGAEFL